MTDPTAARAREALKYIIDRGFGGVTSPAIDQALGILRSYIERAERAETDARRYRELRECNWYDSPLCVVTRPKESVRPGSDCPSLGRLDAALDAALAAMPTEGSPAPQHPRPRIRRER
jgi:hypothetical protein